MKNNGASACLGLKVIISETNKVAGISFPKEIVLDNLDPGKTALVEVPITGLMNLVDYKVSSQQASNLLKRKPFDLEVLLQNTGQGIATGVDAKLMVPQNVYCLSGNESFQKTVLEPGEQVIISYNLVANNDYNLKTLPFTVNLSERYGKYAENKLITLGTITYLKASSTYNKYNTATTDAADLYKKVKIYDMISPIAFGVAGFSLVEYIIKSGKQKKAKKSSLSFIPQYFPGGVGLGITYNF